MNIQNFHFRTSIAALRKLIFPIIAFWGVIFFSSCGYHFQSSFNPLAAQEGIHKIFISPMKNSTFQVGLEGVVYHHLMKTVASHRRVILVSSPQEADAILQGTVDLALSHPSKTTSAGGLIPGGLGVNLPLNMSTFQIANEYVAQLDCSFELNRSHPTPQQKTLVWKGSFKRTKPFPGSNQIDVPGTTSALIHQSQLERALADLVANMMEDVHENMLAMF